MKKFLSNIPTNLIMGFLGVGKTTAILDLLAQKPKNEKWAVLVNEFGQIGIDGAIFKAAGATVSEIPGGCLCCAVGLPFQVAINRLVKEARPDRLLIEPSGIGHPGKVIEMLVTEPFKELLDLRANICLVDPRKLKDKRYTTHENFIDQIALSDVLIANKADQADQESLTLFHQWADKSEPTKMIVAETTHGRLNIDWLDQKRYADRQAVYPDHHADNKNNDQTKENKNDGFHSFGIVFPEQACFDFDALNKGLHNLNTERIKGIFNTNQGWFIINGSHDVAELKPCAASADSRVELILRQGEPEVQEKYFQGFLLS